MLTGERLVFRRLRVGIANVRRQGVGDVAFAGHAFKTPVQRDPDGLHLLAVDVQRAQSASHHGNRANEAALAADFHPIAVSDTFAFRQPFADFDKLFRLRDGIEQRMLGPVWKCSVRR